MVVPGVVSAGSAKLGLVQQLVTSTLTSPCVVEATHICNTRWIEVSPRPFPLARSAPSSSLTLPLIVSVVGLGFFLVALAARLETRFGETFSATSASFSGPLELIVVSSWLVSLALPAPSVVAPDWQPHAPPRLPVPWVWL